MFCNSASLTGNKILIMMKTKVVLLAVLCTGIAIIFRIIVPDLSIVYNLWNYGVKDISQQTTDKSGIFTKEQLKEYNGIIKKKLYLSILGAVYDVSKAEKHYGPGQSYNIFVGRDASKSFITGNFNEGETSDDVFDLTPDELLSLRQWKSFYDREYVRKGVLVGRFYDVDGNPSQYFELIERLFENAEKLKSEKDLDDKQYPPCNIEWNAETGTRVWCSDRSGGVSRSWVGYPRKYFKPGSDSHRCACIKNVEEKDPKIEQYENCGTQSNSCYIIT